MSKSKIVIADADMNYIVPLQQKFVEEFFEKIDLEIISDRNYFNEFFSSAKKIDVLIVSEDLYFSDIQRHNIGRIFIMTEQYNEFNDDSSLGVDRIYKYTSIKEIFNVIVGKSEYLLNRSGTTAKAGKIILVTSASGGAGKTTIALGISACLNKNFKKVLYLNAERLQSFQIMLSNVSSIKEPGVYSELGQADTDAFFKLKHTIRNEGFNYIPPFRASLMALSLKYSIFEKIALSAKSSNEYDYIIIDADTVLDEEKFKLIDIADNVVLVTRQTKISVYATNNYISNINNENGDKFIFLCNDFVEGSSNELIAPDIISKFTVSNYIEHISDYEQLKASDLASRNDFQKITYLII